MLLDLGIPRTLLLLPGCPLLSLMLLIGGEWRIPFAEEFLGWRSGELSSLSQGKSLGNVIEPVIAAGLGLVFVIVLRIACQSGVVKTKRGANIGVAIGLLAVVALYFAMPTLTE